VQSVLLGFSRGTLWPHVAFTLRATVTGIVIGAGLGLVLGLVVGEVPVLERAIYPLVVGIQSVPKVAFAPLIIVYFGLGMASKIFTVALLAFFPVFVGMVAGLKSADRDLLDLYRTFNASRSHVLLWVKLPATATYVFAGLKVAVVVGLIGCITSEFIASTHGLGFLIKSRAGELDVSLMFACVLMLAAFGVLASFAVDALARRCIFWERRSVSSPSSH
jgi:NitT/TauT family transport system permease protein